MGFGVQGTCENSQYIAESESESESTGPYAAAQACNCTCPTLQLPPANATNTTATSRRGLTSSSLHRLSQRELEVAQPPATVAANCVLTCSRFCCDIGSCGCACNVTTNSTTPARRGLNGLLSRRKNLAQTKLDMHRREQDDPGVPGQTQSPSGGETESPEGETEGGVRGCEAGCPVLCANRDGTTPRTPEKEEGEVRALAAPPARMETELQKEQRLINTFNRKLYTLPIFITPGYGCQRYGASPRASSKCLGFFFSPICCHW